MDYPDILDEDFYVKLLRKKEIREYKTSNRISKYKKLEPQQILLRNYISPVTPYNGLLVFHETGVGKTGVAISISERFKEFLPTRILVLIRSETIAKNFKNELAKKIFTGDNYATDEERRILESGNNQEKIDIQRTISRRINKQYLFMTHGTFINRTIGRRPLQKLDESERAKGREIIGEQITDLNNTLVIVDEAHNLTGNDGFKAIRMMLNKSINTKVVLLSATPAFDNVKEIIEMLNIILPKDQQLPDRLNKKDAINLFKTVRLFDKKNYKAGEINSPISIPVLTDKGESILKKYSKGLVSYLKANKKTFPTQIQKGTPLMNQKGSVKVVKCKLSNYQWETVKLALSRDQQSSQTGSQRKSQSGSQSGSQRGSMLNKEVIKSSVAFKNTSDATSFVSPIMDNEGYGKYGKNILTEIKNSNEAKKELTGETLKKYSAKLYKLVNNLEKIKGKGTSFVFSGFVEGGVNLIGEILKLNGYAMYGSSSNLPKFALLSGQIDPAKREKLRKIFNKKENVNGSYISVLLATPVFAEGITLRNVRQIHILEPAWNMSRLIQVEGRGIRNNSHIDLKPEDRTVETYKYCAIAPENIDTIDEIKYKVAEKKDRSIKKAERILKKSAIDCALNKDRNKMSTEYEDTSKCDYTSCNYHCDSGLLPPFSEEDSSTWHFSVTKADINQAKNYIKDLYKIAPFWSLENLFEQLNVLAGISKDITALALNDLIEKQETLSDQYNREGYLIYRGKYYIFQPDSMNQLAGIYQRIKPPSKPKNMNVQRYLLDYGTVQQTPQHSPQYKSPQRHSSPGSGSRKSGSGSRKSGSGSHKSGSGNYTLDDVDQNKLRNIVKNSVYATKFTRVGKYDGKFRIVDNRKIKSKTDQRKFTSGQACESIPPNKLNDIITYLKTMDKNGILNEIKDKSTKQQTCKILYSFFQTYNLLIDI